VNWKGRGRKRSESKLRKFIGIYLEQLRDPEGNLTNIIAFEVSTAVASRFAICSHAVILIDLFDLEEGGDMFFRKSTDFQRTTQFYIAEDSIPR
jgi:hypothetical protein